MPASEFPTWRSSASRLKRDVYGGLSHVAGYATEAAAWEANTQSPQEANSREPKSESEWEADRDGAI